MVARNLSFSYRLPDGGYLQAVEDVSLEVREGEVLAIVGQTGSGKSTLAHILANVIKPESGEVLFMEGDVRKGKYGNRVNGIQIVFQDPFSSTSNRFTVLDAVKEPLYINKIGSNGDRLQMVKSALNLFAFPQQIISSGNTAGGNSAAGRGRGLHLQEQWLWNRNSL